MAQFVHPAARYFQDFQIGDKILSQGRTITETDIVSFAGLSGDYNPLHLDAEYTRDGMFGGRIAHGLLILSVASGLAWQLGFMAGTVEAFLSLEWKFRAPVKIGDTIHVEAEVKHCKAMPSANGGIVSLDVLVKNQAGKTTQKGQWTVMIKNRPAE
ncbi:MAG: MaoC family dehydratase N-terminal domain-containing protein [Thermoflexales bacterium]|nr:MaoC family dehydratase N-terminal domain-containing protein [Thermoflexales bacterium]